MPTSPSYELAPSLLEDSDTKRTKNNSTDIHDLAVGVEDLQREFFDAAMLTGR
jgi:hypothetical protein